MDPSRSRRPDYTVSQSRVTIKDVASAAGVSVATVSRVLSGSRAVSPELAGRVREAAERLNYTSNQVAASLRKARALSVGLITSDSTNPYSVEVCRTAQLALAAEGYMAILCDAARSADREAEYLDILLGTRVAGCILITPMGEASFFEKYSRRHRLPIVLVDSLRSTVLDSVRVDNYAGTLHGVAHLVSRGYRRIAVVAGRQSSLAGFERLDAFRRAVDMYHLECPESYVRIGSFSEETGYYAALELLQVTPRPQAIFACNNTIGIGVFRALKSQKIQIPAEMGLLIFDDVILADLCDPPLSVVAQPVAEIGKTAAQLLLTRLGGDATCDAREIVLPPRLIVRGSV